MSKISRFLKENFVPILFACLCVLSIYYAAQPASYIVNEVSSRVTRNSLLILSLIIPVICGMGLNFSIVLGAMAGEIGLILCMHWKMDGMACLLISMLIGTIVAIALGYLTGKLFNKVKGQEMITGLILGFFAIGVYDLIFMCLVGTIIPFNDPEMMVAVTAADGSIKYTGLAVSLNLPQNAKYAFDNLFSFRFISGCLYLAIISAIVCIVSAVLWKAKKKKTQKIMIIYAVLVVVFLTLNYLIHHNKHFYKAFFTLRVPTGTWILVLLGCLMISFITKTKLGQDIRAVGQNMQVSIAAGINVDRTRIIATIISTVIASWGQIIYLQNIGTMQTYYSHEQVGTYAVAAILVGGATIDKAKISHVFLGALLFHTLFFTTPLSATALFGDAQLGEYFRVFFCYGIIAASLLLFAIKKNFAISKQSDEK